MRPGISQAEPLCVLIVEDDPILSLDLSEQLREYNCIVCGVANSGAKALKLAAMHRPHLALVDVGIDGDMDGVDLAVALRRNLALPSIIVTGWLSSDLAERTRPACPAGFLSKPYLPDDLEKVLHEAHRILGVRTS
jgi:DNA-binding NarL/FixJ family response regulator